MTTEEILPTSLEDAQGRNPLEFPFGFYIEDDYEQSSGGSFFWYKAEKERQHAIQHDLIDELFEGNNDDIQALKAEMAAIIEEYKAGESDDLLNSLNKILGDIDVQLQFIGTFEELCKSKNEWPKYFREFYREEYLEDIEDIPSKKLQSSIKKAEQHDFADYVSDYLI